MSGAAPVGGGVPPNSTYDSSYMASAPREKIGKIPTRRESGRQVKKVNKDLPEAQVDCLIVVLKAGNLFLYFCSHIFGSSKFY